MFLKCSSRQSNCCLGTPWSFYSFHRKLRLWGFVGLFFFFKVFLLADFQSGVCSDLPPTSLLPSFYCTITLRKPKLNACSDLLHSQKLQLNHLIWQQFTAPEQARVHWPHLSSLAGQDLSTRTSPSLLIYTPAFVGTMKDRREHPAATTGQGGWRITAVRTHHVLSIEAWRSTRGWKGIGAQHEVKAAHVSNSSHGF